MIELLTGDCRDILATLPDQSVQCVVTSPPYWMARTYTNDPREIGQEPTPAEYVAALVTVFAACWRVLRNDGTLWLNIGDRYSSSSIYNAPRSMHTENGWKQAWRSPNANVKATGLPSKSLIGLPWHVAFALQDAGWVLRSEIIWHKTNGMPESVDDRPTRAHEQVFLFAKQGDYYYDAQAIRTPGKEWKGSAGTFKRTNGKMTAMEVPGQSRASHRADRDDRVVPGANARSVWSFPVSSIPDEHYAPMPQTLAERCILAGSRPGDTVLDPFAGSGTTGRAAAALQRGAVLIDLAYQELQQRRTDKVQVRMDLSE